MKRIRPVRCGVVCESTELRAFNSLKILSEHRLWKRPP
jgi:hypothetical protein